MTESAKQKYPINASYSPREGLTHDGYAESASEALAVMNDPSAGFVPDTPYSLPTLRMIECSFVGIGDMLKDGRTGWEAEIAAGWASLQQCGNVWKVCVDTWSFD
jgi:hypothetical protein